MHDSLARSGLTGQALLVQILNDALQAGAGWFHLEPREGRTQVRYAVDGRLRVRARLGPGLHQELLDNLCRLAAIEMFDDDPFHSGELTLTVAGVKRTATVQMLRTLEGRRATVRFRPETASLRLEDIGLDPPTYDRVTLALASRPGLILCCGSAGSGLSTFSRALLRHLAAPHLSVAIGAKSPVPPLDLADHVVVDRARDGTPAQAALAADVDVLELGALDRTETIAAAFQQARRGRTVIASLPTHEAPIALGRLIDWRISPRELVDSLVMIVGLRLARVLCGSCRIPYLPDAASLSSLGLDDALLDRLELPRRSPDRLVLHRAGRCADCRFSGYRGQTALVQALIMCDELARALPNYQVTAGFERAARAAGMRTFREIGLRKALVGETSLEEVVRVTPRWP